MARHLASWQVSDEFWARVAPLIPVRQRAEGKEFRRKVGGGRKPLAARKVFEGIVYVLRTGCQWKALPKQAFGSASAIHKYFLQWEAAGVFLALWRAGLAEYDELAGVAWEWQSIDGAMSKAPLAQESVGRNPTDRGKKWNEAQPVGGRPWRPVVDRRRRRQSARRETAGADVGGGGGGAASGQR